MSDNANYLEKLDKELIIPARNNNFSRYIKNFVIKDFDLADGGGLTLNIGTVAANSFAYIDGVEIKQVGQTTETLTDDDTNFVFVQFIKTTDPIVGVNSVVFAIEVNITGTPPANSIKLGEVDTVAGSITVIRKETDNFLFVIDDARFASNIEGKQFQITELVVHKGTTFPSNPTKAQLFYKTDTDELFIFNGTVFELIEGTVSETFQFTVQQAGGVTAGEILKIVADDKVEKAQATSVAKSRITGIAEVDTADTATVTVNIRRIIMDAQFEQSLTLAANEKVFLSTTAGRLTNVAPSSVGETITIVGTISDKSAYVGTTDANSKVDIFFNPSEPILIS